MPYTVVLLRHGESQWNRLNVFTGWTDVDLTDEGRWQAMRAGNILKAHGFSFDLAFTSVLKRAVRTLDLALDEMELLHIKDVKSWRLNERHYGALQGLNKAQTAEQYGDEQVRIWRRSYKTQPPALPHDDPRHPRFDPRYVEEAAQAGAVAQPSTECLADCVARTLPFWHDTIAPAVRSGKHVIVAAHGNSLRGIVKLLDDISDEGIMDVEIPVGTPLVYELDEQTLKPVRHYYLGEPQVIGGHEANPDALVQPSMFGLLSPAGGATRTGLAAWLADLQRLGLTRQQGVLQLIEPASGAGGTATKTTAQQPRSAAGASASSGVANDDLSVVTQAGGSEEPLSSGAGGSAAAAVSSVPAAGGASATEQGDSTRLALEGVVPVDDVAALLQHCRFVLLDLARSAPSSSSGSGSGISSAAQLLLRAADKLDPAQHTLLLVASLQTPKQLVDEVRQAVPNGVKALLVHLPPPRLNAAEHALRVAKLHQMPGPAARPQTVANEPAGPDAAHAQKSGATEAIIAATTTGDAQTAGAMGAATAAATGATLEEAVSAAVAVAEGAEPYVATVTAVGAAGEQDVQRVLLMLQYTGRVAVAQ